MYLCSCMISESSLQFTAINISFSLQGGYLPNFSPHTKRKVGQSAFQHVQYQMKKISMRASYPFNGFSVQLNIFKFNGCDSM